MTKRSTGRPHKASIERSGRATYARLHLRDGSRPRVRIPDDLTAEEARQFADSAQAQAWASEMQRVSLENETVSAWFARYFARRETTIRGLRQERSRFATYIEPTFGDRPMRSLSKTDLETFVAKLDDAVTAGAMSWRSAIHAWALFAHALREAYNSKRIELRVLETDITTNVRGPDRKRMKAKQYLYPSEVALVLGCDRAPLRWRRLIALSIYLYTRPGELAVLDWQDVDLEHRMVYVHKADDGDGGDGETKTGAKRAVPIEPALVPLLEKMAAEAGQRGRVVTMPPEEDLSERLRKYLQWAGVTRAGLFVPARHPTQKRITWYDLRATGITWRIVRGDNPIAVQRAAGHDDQATTLGYVRETVATPHFGAPFDALPMSLLDSVSVQGRQSHATGALKTAGIEASPAGSAPLDSSLSGLFQTEVIAIDLGLAV